MAITVAQRNAGYRQLVLNLVANRPDKAEKLLRQIVKEVKNGLNATQREIAKAVAREIYQSAYGIDPVGQHTFVHILQNILQHNADESDGLSISDAFDAENITVS